MGNHVKVLFRYHAFEEESIESAWARKQDGKYVLDNILFYAKEYAWGDVISVAEENGKRYVVGLITESGHSTVRILFDQLSDREHLRAELREMGCASEVSNYEKLIAVDIPADVSYTRVIQFLKEKERQGTLEYEEACISSQHRASFGQNH